VVLLLLLELGLRAVVAGRDVSWPSEAGYAFALPADCMLVCLVSKEIKFQLLYDYYFGAIVTSDLSRTALPCRESESRAGGTCAISVNKSNPYRLIIQDCVYIKIFVFSLIA